MHKQRLSFNSSNIFFKVTKSCLRCEASSKAPDEGILFELKLVSRSFTHYARRNWRSFLNPFVFCGALFAFLPSFTRSPLPRCVSLYFWHKLHSCQLDLPPWQLPPSELQEKKHQENTMQLTACNSSH